VAAVLTLQFAQTINVALSIAEFLNRPCDRVVTPLLQAAIPAEYDKWVPVVLRVSNKSAPHIYMRARDNVFCLFNMIFQCYSCCYKMYKRMPYVQWITKSIAMSIAWYIQSIQSAFASALIGGVMIGHSFVHFCAHRGITLGGLIPPRHQDTMVDEVLSYIFAAMGFYFQLRLGFKLPFPLNLVLWPFGTADYYIRWAITKRA
jgi:hypothetical protein